ncbi:BspA family leucine-rich repeat surface protein [Candidatus Nanosyncoccus nanoralicus]|uniref:BspA family leucine-rich repeat surface protein n=1 Tax=Candidatus Nanosyncoccus nanoralicus TaxID=2171996 RepID=A0ABY0FKT6_9BACT|nr:BspA family leucine-rich repeat surface protein [Candidatus Nanosyncoccus nanoralicus]RYC74041.1 hypothetical protein G3KMM_00089 [Candidatus Nanosyncoccus nanoralicus]
MNFSNTKRANVLRRFQFSKIFYLIPFLTLSFLVTLLGIFVIESSDRTTFATPGAPGSPGHPATLITSVSSPTVNFHFSAAELQSSAFKTSSVTVNISTNNETGATTYLSSVDEDTSLNSTDPTISQKFTSITSETSSSGFTQNKWGYRASTSAPNGNYKPIAKASQADLLYTENIPNTVTYNLEFGVKPSPDLPSGTYTKRILISSVTNHVPTSTVLIPGQNFKNAITSLGPTGVVKSFKRANAAPPAGAATTVVSTADSEVPAYAWYDPAAQSILWWSDADTAYANEDSSYMFHDIGDNYSDMDLIDMTGINTSRVKNMSWMFHGGKWIVKHINLTGFDTSNVEDMSYMFGSFTMGANFDIDPIDFSSFDTSKVTNMEAMFDGSYLPSIDIRNFNTSSVTNMRRMFAEQGKLKELDLTGLNVSNVTYIDGFLWQTKEKLTSLSMSGWDLSHITDMSGFFSNMTNLEYLNLQDFKTTNVTNMKAMFKGTKKLRDLDLFSFDTSQVSNMSSMFEDMESLTTINLSSFDTSNVTTMNRMFFMNAENPPITELDLSSFNTSQVTDMERMFVGLAYLQNLNVSSFDTRNVENMEAMFYYTFVVNQNDTQLDISNFDTHNLRRADGMFNYMKVKTIYASPNFVTDNLTPNPANIFMDNSNLTGGNGTTWAWPNYTSNFAHIDAPGNPGYFTQKP